jgi:hypothetical protein
LTRKLWVIAGQGSGDEGAVPQVLARVGILPGIVTALVLVLPFLMYLVSLDRYPLYYEDEPFFSEPAVRYLSGKSFAYRVSAQAPFGDLVFAAHSPFFPWLQVEVIRLLGVNQFAARLAEYVSAYLAVGVLAAFMFRRGLWVTAVALALAWSGDRASQEVMLGRLEGLALLALVFGYIDLVRAL